MEKLVFFAVPIGLITGIFVGFYLGKLLSKQISKCTSVPRLVRDSSIAFGLLLIIFGFPFSIYVGGLLGGGFGGSLSDSLSIHSVEVPIGIALGIAITYACCIVSGAFVGALFGKLLSHILPKAALDWYSSRGRHRIKDASVRGGEMLISVSNKWQELEDEHLAANLGKSLTSGDSKI